MSFKKVISISAIKIIKSELIKYDLKKFFPKSKFEIWDLGDYFYKEKIKYLNSDKNINLKYYKKFKNLNDILKSLKKLDSNDLLIDSFNISNLKLFRKIIINKNIKILQFHLGPIPTLNHERNFLIYLKIFFNSPKYYLKKIIDPKINTIAADYLMVVNRKNIKNLNYKISSKTKIILSHSFDYYKYLEFSNFKIKPNLKYRFAVFLDEGVTGHPDYHYLNLNPFCDHQIYFEELKKYFDFLENKLDLKIIIAAHPKIDYSKFKNKFLRKIFYNKTLELVKNSDLVLSHMSTSINFAVIYNKPIIFLDSNNYVKSFRSHINLHSDILKSTLINLSNKFNTSDLNNCFKINKNSYKNYKNRYITHNTNDIRSPWKILHDYINY